MSGNGVAQPHSLFRLFPTVGVLRVEDVPGTLLGFLPRRRLLP